ncbi:MAG TPA: tetratricopeptide repeat protein [Caldilineae bacterium]|nr:tetratricopeptide repeat protein [Caldilineae bacterium]
MSDSFETIDEFSQNNEEEWWNDAEPQKPSTPWSWRIAGILLIVLLIVRVLLLLWTGPEAGELLGSWRLLFDLILGAGLIAGAAWARSWALWRAGIYIVFSIWAAFQDTNYLDIILQVSVGISLFLLLWETPGKLRTLAGVLVFVMGVFGVLVVGIGITAINAMNQWDEVVTLIDEENYMEAEEKINQRLAEQPDDDMAFNLLGLVYSQQDDSDTAIDYFNKAIELDPTYYLYYYNRASEWIYLENYDAAIKDIEKVGELTNNGYEVDTLYVRLYLTQIDSSKAKEALERAEQKGAPEEEVSILRFFIQLLEQAEQDEASTESG